MKKQLLQRALAACLAALLLLAPVHTASAASGFIDVPSMFYCAEAVDALSSAGILKGYEDGTFRPNSTITRVEMAVVTCRMMGLPTQSVQTPFADVPEDYWGAKYIAAAYQAGIIRGSKGLFRPGDNVTYEEAVKMVVCAAGLGEGITSSGANWAVGYLAAAKAHGITNNVSKAKISTRGDVAVMVHNALRILQGEKLPVEEGTTWRFLFVILKNNDFTAAASNGQQVHDTHVMDQEEIDILVNAIHAFETDMPVVSNGKVRPVVDIILSDAPVTHLSTCDSGPWLSHDDAYDLIKDQVDIDLYDHITLIADLRSLKLGYWGLGGTWMKNGTGYTFIKAADTNLWAMEQRWAPEVFVHELLHFMSNWAELRGYQVPVHLHSSEKYGYKEDSKTGEKTWLVDFINNAVPVGDGTYAGIPQEVWAITPRSRR